MNSKPIAEPMKVACVGGEVVILGPNGLAGSMTPDAAEASAARLRQAAAEARTQSPDVDEEP